MALTIAQIHAAASLIDSAGQKPTLAGIRAKLGSGSYSTISAALQTWERQGDEDPDDLPAEIPSEVQAAADLQSLTIWQLAVKTARGEFDVERSNAKNSMESSVKANQAMQNDCDAMQKEILSLEAQLSNMTALAEVRKDRLESTCTDLTNALAKLESAELVSSERLRTIEAIRPTKTPPGQAQNQPKSIKAKPKKPDMVLKNCFPLNPHLVDTINAA